jgi:hypothetical protein
MNHSDFGLEPHTVKTLSVGDKCGRLTVLLTGRKPGTYRYMAVCKCDCGKQVVSRVDGLRNGTATSCGCYQRDAVTKHGRWDHPLYSVWRSMWRRCTVKLDRSYPDYGGRGITVCDQWKDIEKFIADMSPTHFDGGTLERKDFNGNYCPENCIWITHAEQASNKRSNVMITHGGITQTLEAWAEFTGITYGTLWSRIKTYGWTPERALTTPPLDATDRCELARAQCSDNRLKR